LVIKFYMVVGKHDAYEEVIRSVAARIREELKKRGEGSEKAPNVTFIRIRPETVETALKALRLPDNQIPQNILYLVRSMRQDRVNAVPALIVNNQKLFEGELPDPGEVEAKLLDVINSIISTPQPMQQAQQIVTPPPVPQLPKPTEQPKVPESLEEVMKELVRRPTEQPPVPPPSPPPSPPPPPSVPSIEGYKLVLGRPDDCRECLYYGSYTSTCLLFGFRISNVSRPPCKFGPS